MDEISWDWISFFFISNWAVCPPIGGIFMSSQGFQTLTSAWHWQRFWIAKFLLLPSVCRSWAFAKPLVDPVFSLIHFSGSHLLRWINTQKHAAEWVRRGYLNSRNPLFYKTGKFSISSFDFLGELCKGQYRQLWVLVLTSQNVLGL